MVNLNHPFYLALKNKLRFTAGNSQLSTEQLFDLPVRSNNSKNLNSIFATLAKKVEEDRKFSLDGKVPQNDDNIKLEVVRTIYITKMEEQRRKKARNLQRAVKDHKRNLAAQELAKREEQSFSKMSDAELLSYLV
jgi:hypothetical protein